MWFNYFDVILKIKSDQSLLLCFIEHMLFPTVYQCMLQNVSFFTTIVNVKIDKVYKKTCLNAIPTGQSCYSFVLLQPTMFIFNLWKQKRTEHFMRLPRDRFTDKDLKIQAINFWWWQNDYFMLCDLCSLISNHNIELPDILTPALLHGKYMLSKYFNKK